MRNKAVSVIVLLGVLLRVSFWATLFPIWKHFATFLVFRVPVVEYLGNFQGYKPVRSPFYDMFSASLYVLTAPILDVRATTVFSLVVSCLAVPAMFFVSRRFFDREVAIFSTTLYAFFPKILVLSGRGFPEAASTGVILLSLLAITDRSGNLRSTMTAGTAVTVAYLLYVPTIIFGIWTGVCLFWTCARKTGTPSKLSNIPTGVLNYALVPSVVGILYLIYGPARGLLSGASGESGTGRFSLFIDASSYDIFEKSVRYIIYHYFDFWWHLRGFDKETHILSTIEKIQAFFGDLSILFFAGWGGVTLLLTLPILLGLGRLARQRTMTSTYLLGWLFSYLLIDTYRNLGWTGGFQVRHIFPIFIVVGLAFGVGAQWIRKSLSQTSIHSVVAKRNRRFLPDLEVHTVLYGVIVLLLSVLVVTAFVNTQFTAQNNRLSMQEPTEQMLDAVGPGANVAVTNQANYHWTVLFSEGQIWPAIWVKDEQQAKKAESRTVVAEEHIVAPTEIPDSEVDFLYIVEPCGTISERQQQLVDAALRTGGETIFNKTRKNGNRCTIQTILVEL